MFHLSDNVFFGRLPDGKVRILKLAKTPPDFPRVTDTFADALFDITVDDGGWGSIVASVSAKGEIDGRWYRAMDFHHGAEVTVNGKTHRIHQEILSYDDICILSQGKPVDGLSVTVSGPYPIGDRVLSKGQLVPVKGGLRVNAYRTGAA